jgi:hypothetical protein
LGGVSARSPIFVIIFDNFLRLYASGFCYNNIGKAMLWRIVVSVAIVEVLLCVLPIELAGVIALLRLWLFGG